MDFAAFNALHMPALERDEAKHNLILAIMARAAAGPVAGKILNWSFGEPGACAVRTEGRGLVMGELTRHRCRRLADELAGTRFDSVMGPDETAPWFVERAKELGERFEEPTVQRIHALSDAPHFPGAAGAPRPITYQDRELFGVWLAAFAAEAVPADPPVRQEEIDLRASSGDCLFWLAGGEPVSMAGIVRRTRNAGAIAFVYTPPDLRGKGYAGSATAAVVEKIFAEGKRTACLYTDVTNRASNRCYAKIGFKPVCDSWFVLQAAREHD